MSGIQKSVLNQKASKNIAKQHIEFSIALSSVPEKAIL
jgi:hypothetical protein